MKTITFTEKEETKNIHKIGNIYSKNITTTLVYELYLLVACDTKKVCLVNLKTGNRWVKPINVKEVSNISQEEFKKCSGMNGKFKLFKGEITITQ